MSDSQPVSLSADKLALITRGVTDVVPRNLAVEKLASGKKMRLYLGIDPTGAKLHVGHSVPLLKLRDFQNAGHHVIFLIGSFTAMIGDPTGRDKMREALTREDVIRNFESYKEQAEKILDFSKVELRYNDEWLAPLSFSGIINLASNFTVQQMLERDMYQKRIKEGNPISLVEFMYPLMVGYDSVILDVDFEVGGNDQLFNMLAGRTLQQAFGKRDKFVLTTKLVEGTDGRKMSKTYNNCIYINDSANEMYGKVMSIQDSLIMTYFECCTRIEQSEIAALKSQLESGENPRNIKMRLARELVTMYHSENLATEAEAEFVKIFQKKDKPTDIPTVSLGAATMGICDVIVAVGFAKSKSDAKRLIEGGGVSIDEVKLTDYKATVELGGKKLLQVGKRHFVYVER